jgi:thymidylate synthase
VTPAAGTTGFPSVYAALLDALLKHGVEQENARTGHAVLALYGGFSFCLDLSSGGLKRTCARASALEDSLSNDGSFESVDSGLLPVPGCRRVYPATAAAEVAWFIRGSKDVSWLRKHAPVWDKFVEADGVTVEAAYGYRWRSHFGRDQLSLAVDALVRDPSDRQVLVCAWDPGSDALGAPVKKNVPCPAFFHLSVFNLKGGRRMVQLCLFIRSSDVFVGLPYDVMGYALLADAVAAELSERTGALHRAGALVVTLAHPHLYDSHWIMARRARLEAPVETLVPLPGHSISSIERDPDGYVALVKSLACLDTRQPDLSVRPEVIE